MKCLIKFLQGEDLTMETTTEPKDILALLNSNFKFAVVYDDDDMTLIINTDNINSLKMLKEPVKLPVLMTHGK